MKKNETIRIVEELSRYPLSKLTRGFVEKIEMVDADMLRCTGVNGYVFMFTLDFVQRSGKYVGLFGSYTDQHFRSREMALLSVINLVHSLDSNGFLRSQPLFIPLNDKIYIRRSEIDALSVDSHTFNLKNSEEIKGYYIGGDEEEVEVFKGNKSKREIETHILSVIKTYGDIIKKTDEKALEISKHREIGTSAEGIVSLLKNKDPELYVSSVDWDVMNSRVLSSADPISKIYTEECSIIEKDEEAGIYYLNIKEEK